MTIKTLIFNTLQIEEVFYHEPEKVAYVIVAFYLLLTLSLIIKLNRE